MHVISRNMQFNYAENVSAYIIDGMLQFKTGYERNSFGGQIVEYYKPANTPSPEMLHKLSNFWKL